MLTASRSEFPDADPELHESGERVGDLAGPGSLTCVECGFALSMGALEELPDAETLPTCPNCGATTFRRTSIFDRPTVAVDPPAPAAEAPEWLDEARSEIDAPGFYLAYSEEGATKTLRLAEGWTRIGRSGSADLRLDDPTVSRRHALVVNTEGDELRALDDRSLNGLFVNGHRVDWSRLGDGDELEIGRYRLYVIAA